MKEFFCELLEGLLRIEARREVVEVIALESVGLAFIHGGQGERAVICRQFAYCSTNAVFPVDVAADPDVHPRHRLTPRRVR